MTNRIPQIIKDWADSIKSRNPIRQTKFYSKDAILLATYEPILLGRQEIYDYFVDLLSKTNIRCTINENYAQVNLDTIIASGLYTFSFDDDNNVTQYVKARYTFVVRAKDNLILDHHSSEEPNQ
jgi:hypothetical protein